MPESFPVSRKVNGPSRRTVPLTGREMADIDGVEQDLAGRVALAQKLVGAAPAERALPEDMIGELIGYRHAGVLGLPVAIKPSRIEHTVLVVHDPQSA